MNNQEIVAKVQALMQDEQFKEKLANAESLDEMAGFFRDEGIEVTGADLEAALEASKNGEELSEESLENVAGGFSGILAAGAIIFIGGSILLGYIDGVKAKGKKKGWW